MAHQYGIRKARETLICLASAEDIQSRLEKALKEIMALSEIHMPPDTGSELFERRDKIYQTYTTLVKGSRYADIDKMEEIAHRLAELSADVIERNSKLLEIQRPGI